MRCELALALGTSLSLVAAMPVMAQTYGIQVESDQIILDQGDDADFIDFPEEAARQSIFEASDYFSTLFNQQYGTGPRFTAPTLPSPYNTSVASQAGYYRVTQTTPRFEVVQP